MKCRKIRYRYRNPDHTRVIQRVRDAVKRGILQKPLCCEDCRQPKPARLLTGHHDDYALPLVVRWLCDACHRRWHRHNGQGANYPGSTEYGKERPLHRISADPA